MPLRQTSLLSAAALSAMIVPAHSEVTVIASIKPVHSLVAAVMQGAGEPVLIVEGAGSPHTYSLKPSQAAALQEADVVFWIGEALEAFLEKPIETIGSHARAVELVDAPGVEVLGLREGGAFDEHGHDEEDDAAPAHEAHDDEHGLGDIDMHVWLDPLNAAAMAHEIAAALGDADPDNAALYTKNAAALDLRLQALTAELAEDLAPVRGAGYIVFHDSYQYFEHRFGLTPAGSITVSPDVMPGADRLTEIRAKVSELGAACVFAEPQFEPKLISVVTEGTDARAGTLDPLGAEADAGPELYFEVMRGLAGSFTTCLAEAS